MTLRTVLIVEDERGHAVLLEKSLRRLGMKHPVITFANGLEVWQYLNGLGKDEAAQASKQFVLLLDINMPLMDAFQLLDRFRDMSALDAIPRILLSTSDDQADMQRAETFGYIAYHIKPPNYQVLLEEITALDNV
jgi:CheY-like chemotaxis protein